MPGPDMMQPTGEALAIEQKALLEVGLQGNEFDDLPFRVGRGERRPLRMVVTDAAAEAHDEGLSLRFTLPKGGYATAVLRELLHDTKWFAGEERGRRRRR